MNKYLYAAIINNITRTKVIGLPIRYMDIRLTLSDGSDYAFSWSHSPSVSTSNCSFGNKEPKLFDLFWNNDEISLVYLHHKGDISAQYITPMFPQSSNM